MKNTHRLIISNIAFSSQMRLFSILQSNGDATAIIPTQKSATAKNPMMCWFWCEADVYCRRGRWQTHFQPSLRCKGTSREPKTTFPFIYLFFFKNGCLGFYNCFHFLEQGEFSNVIKRKNCVHMCFIKPSGLIGLHFV